MKIGDLIRWASTGQNLPGQCVGVIMEIHYPCDAHEPPWVAVKWPQGDVGQPMSFRGFEIVSKL